MNSVTRLIACAVLLASLARTASAPDPAPQPPCESSEVSPPYPEVDRPPVEKVWEKGDLGLVWRPPACTGWEEPGFLTLVVTVARFHFAGGRDALLRRIGAISSLKGIEYWSTTRQQWHTLILDAFALSAPTGDSRRDDFSPQEMADGRPLFFEQEDSLSGKGTYEMRIRAASADRIVFDTSNLGTLRFMMLPVFHPREIQSIYFLDRDPQPGSKGIWRYYNVARIGQNASALASGHAASAINRAAAFYRHLAGLPTDKDHPDAR